MEHLRYKPAFTAVALNRALVIPKTTLALPAQGPWNHSARLEQLPNAVFSAVVDPNLDLANKRIKELQQGELCSAVTPYAMQHACKHGACMELPCTHFASCSHAQSGIRTSAEETCQGTSQGAFPMKGNLQRQEQSTRRPAVQSLTGHVSIGTWASCSFITHDSPSVQAGHPLHHATPLGAGQHGDKWQDTKAFKTYQEMLQSEQSKPDAAFIGVPPQFHGGLSDKNNIEVRESPAAHCCLYTPQHGLCSKAPRLQSPAQP